MTNAHSETGQMAVCCENLTLGVFSSCIAPPVLVGALFKKFGLFLNISRILYSHLLSVRLKRLYRTVILRIVLYGFATWLRVFQSRIMRKIFGPKRVEETGEWRKLHNEGFMICVPHQMLFG